MNDDQLRQAYQARRAQPADATEPSPEELRRLAAGEGSEAERLETLDRAFASRTAAGELELLRAVAHAARAQSRPRWRAPLPIALAASLLVTVVGVFALRERPREGVRATGSDGAPVLLAPAVDARIAGTVQFAWRPVAGARAYRLELLTDAGTVVASIETPDTVVAYRAPAITGAPYRWVVVALLPEGIEVSSRPRRLTITTP